MLASLSRGNYRFSFMFFNKTVHKNSKQVLMLNGNVRWYCYAKGYNYRHQNFRGHFVSTQIKQHERHLKIQYIPKNMHTVFALLCFVVVIHWLIIPYPSGLLHWHCGNLTIAPVPAKQPWWIWINTSCKFIMNDCITTTKQSTTKPCAFFLGYTVICKCTACSAGCSD